MNTEQMREALQELLDECEKGIATCPLTRAKARAALTHPPKPARVGGVYAWAVTGVSKLYQGEHAEGQAKAEAAYIGGTCVAFPLFTAAPQAPADVVRDAERYRWLRQSPIANNVALACHFGGSRMQDFDAAIDAAMSTKAGEKA